MLETKIYTLKQFFFYCIVAVIIAFGIYYGLKFLTKKASDNYKKKIDKHGLSIKANVYNKRQVKGWYIDFYYNFKNTSYNESEMNMDYYEKVDLGDIIDIKIDTTNPKECYIITDETSRK